MTLPARKLYEAVLVASNGSGIETKANSVVKSREPR
jgi:hypothetical protein